jgi:hypothetical protein
LIGRIGEAFGFEQTLQFLGGDLFAAIGRFSWLIISFNSMRLS